MIHSSFHCLDMYIIFITQWLGVITAFVFVSACGYMVEKMHYYMSARALNFWYANFVYFMGGTFQVTTRFWGFGYLSESNKSAFEMQFECAFSTFRNQTLTWSHPYIYRYIYMHVCLEEDVKWVLLVFLCQLLQYCLLKSWMVNMCMSVCRSTEQIT